MGSTAATTKVEPALGASTIVEPAVEMSEERVTGVSMAPAMLSSTGSRVDGSGVE